MRSSVPLRGLLVLVAALGCNFDASGAGGSAAVGTSAAVDSGDTQADGAPTSSATSGAGTGGGTTASSSPPDPEADSTGSSTGAPSSTTGSSSDTSTGTIASCDRALWVAGDLDVGSTADAQFHQRLIDLGYQVTLVLNPDAQVSDVGDHCVVVLSAVGSSGDVNSKFRDVAVPVVTMEAFLFDDMQLVASNADCGVTNPRSDVQIVDPGHPMAGGASGVVSVYPANSEMGWGIVPATAQVVAVAADDGSHAMLFGYDTGEMMGGIPAPARRVGFTASGANAGGPTLAGVDLFEAAVTWAAQ